VFLGFKEAVESGILLGIRGTSGVEGGGLECSRLRLVVMHANIFWTLTTDSKSRA
jgi:hypothetical protein